MEDEESFEVDLEQLRSFVSDEIFEFLSAPSTSATAETCDSAQHAATNDDPYPYPALEPHLSLEAEVDRLLLECHLQYDEQPNVPEISTEPPPPPPKRHFAVPKTDQEIAKAKEAAIPRKTVTDTNYCVGLWNQWCSHRAIKYGDTIPPLDSISSADFAHHMSNFVFEIRKKDGSEFPPDSLHHLVSGLQRFVRWKNNPAIDVFKDAEFAEFRRCLDSEMKRLQRAGLGSRRRKAEPLTPAEEEMLWKKGLLGDGTPQSLVDTILVMNGLYFALRSGAEHRQLRSNPCQIQVIEKPRQRPYLEYVEDTSKNRPGGLKGRKMKPKIVQHHDNPDNPARCFVRLFKLYQSLLPKDRPKNAFYFQPLKTPRPDCWFSNKPIGHNTLDGTVARLCQQAQIQGFRTNHSLRATAATRLFQASVDEQLIMERTGHRSLEGVRSYKRTSDNQREALSDILNSGTKKSKLSLSPQAAIASSSHVHVEPSTDVCQHKPVQFTMQNTHSSQSLAMNILPPQSFNFNSCSVNINYFNAPQQ